MDGRSVEDLNIQWLRAQIALVTQEPILFSFSLKENIAYGDNRRNVPMEDIIAAAKQANIHDFIASLPLVITFEAKHFLYQKQKSYILRYFEFFDRVMIQQ